MNTKVFCSEILSDEINETVLQYFSYTRCVPFSNGVEINILNFFDTKKSCL